MPLIAKNFFTGNRVEAFACSDAEWDALRREPKGTLVLRNGQPAVLKRSIRGLKFFAHPPGGRDPDYKPESLAHLEMKAAMVQALRAAGIEASAEVSGRSATGDLWEADVLALPAGRRIALEVQLSPQTLDDYEFRSARYRDSGVEVVWLVKASGYLTLRDALHYRNIDYPRGAHPEFPMFPVRLVGDLHHSGNFVGHEVTMWPAPGQLLRVTPADFALKVCGGHRAPTFDPNHGWIFEEPLPL